jgi:hypothetical protein
MPTHSGSKPGAYRAYLLRLWRETEDGAWRMSLQDSVTSERLGFPDLESLMAYLALVMTQPSNPPLLADKSPVVPV